MKTSQLLRILSLALAFVPTVSAADEILSSAQCEQRAARVQSQLVTMGYAPGAPILIRIFKRTATTQPGQTVTVFSQTGSEQPALKMGTQVRTVAEINRDPHSPSDLIFEYSKGAYEFTDKDSQHRTNRYNVNMGELQVWIQGKDGKYENPDILRFPVQAYSGVLGPKLKQTDDQSPEGLYELTKPRLNPTSQYLRGLDLGYPNAFDRQQLVTGGSVEIHGNSMKDGEPKSAGCYSMGNQICEIYGLTEKALQQGEKQVPVQIFPFPMTAQNLADAPQSLREFWSGLQAVDADFLKNRVPQDFGWDQFTYFLKSRSSAASPTAGKVPNQGAP